MQYILLSHFLREPRPSGVSWLHPALRSWRSPAWSLPWTDLTPGLADWGWADAEPAGCSATLWPHGASFPRAARGRPPASASCVLSPCLSSRRLLRPRSPSAQPLSPNHLVLQTRTCRGGSWERSAQRGTLADRIRLPPHARGPCTARGSGTTAPSSVVSREIVAPLCDRCFHCGALRVSKYRVRPPRQPLTSVLCHCHRSAWGN